MIKVPTLTGAVAALALFATPACARTPATSAPASTAVHPALFAVRDADSTIYLFGTVHVRRPGADWGGANAQAALREASEVWTEIEISPDSDARGQQLAMQLGMAPADQPLSATMTPEQYQRFSALTQRLGVPAANFERMKPWMAAITLTVLPMMQAGYDPQAGIDRAIDAAADAGGKQRRAFETIDQQLGFLAGLSPEMQHQMLLDTIDETEEGPAQLDALSAAWERGDVDALKAQVIDEMRSEYPELYNVLFVQRNAAWVETLIHEMEGSGVDFVAVGAGHLVGPDGLVAQLRARGLRVERVRD